MEVRKSKKFPKHPNYSIEWGYATWTEGEVEENKDWSIRNRYDKADGGYNHVGSKEIPWQDFNLMINESITENQFSKQELRKILKTTVRQILKTAFNKEH